VLARLPLHDRFKEFNCKWCAPEGSRLYQFTKKRAAIQRTVENVLYNPFPRLRGYFSFQLNNTTREYEYPWCFYATDLRAGMRAVDIGGSLAGFQFVLAKHGLEVINVDPGLEAHGLGWPVDQRSIGHLNRAFGTNVRLENCFLQHAKIEAASVDRIFSISVVEHIPTAEIKPLMRKVWEILKPGGLFIATVDLFLNIKPFSSQETNKFGTNIPIPLLTEAAPFNLVTGIRSELYGYPEFSVDKCMKQLDKLLIGRYPTLVQCLVLEKVMNTN